MTREEAIKIFNTLLLFKRVDAPMEEIEECCKMAIKALEQEPCEDCIREGLEALDKWDKFGCDANGRLVWWNKDLVPYIHYEDAVRCIKGMPSVQPKPKYFIKAKEVDTDELEKLFVKNPPVIQVMPKTGKWFDCGASARCSNCGCKDHEYSQHRYCPNCGCKMEGVEE